MNCALIIEWWFHLYRMSTCNAIVVTVLYYIIVLYTKSHFSEARQYSELLITKGCSCQGDSNIYECSILGEGATLWKGSAFNCPETDNEIVLLHSINSTEQRLCNNRAIIGRIVHVKGNIYTSQLTVNISSEVTGSDITCAYDSGEEISVIGSLNITSVPLHPPSDVHLVEANPVQLTFRWSEVSPSCPVVHYRILACNCGQCPHTTSNTTVTCTGNYTQHNFSYCSLSVQTVTCNTIFGEVSTVVNVALTDISLGLVPNMSQNVPTLESNFSQGPTVTTLCSCDMYLLWGIIVGGMAVVTVSITATFVIVTLVLIRSKRALSEEIHHLKARANEELVIYEEIARDSPKSSSPTIDTGENTAYISATVNRVPN